MKPIHVARIGGLVLAMGLGVVAVALTIAFAPALGGPLTVAADGTVDLTVEAEAPAHVASDAPYLVRIAYYNYGTSLPPDAWLTATVPAETQVLTTTDRWGAPLPPDVTDGQTLGWYFEAPSCIIHKRVSKNIPYISVS